MAYSPFEPPKTRNPKTQANTEHETFWQITVPFGVVALVIFGLMLFIMLSAMGVAVPAPIRSLADVSLMALIGLTAAFSLIFLILLIALCALVWFGIKELPYFFRRVQDWLWLATMHVKTYSQQVDVRVVDLRQSIAAVQSMIDSMQSLFNGKAK
jgi:hypothetical protein